MNRSKNSAAICVASHIYDSATGLICRLQSCTPNYITRMFKITEYIDQVVLYKRKPVLEAMKRV
jgi:hypothetical protein